MNSNRPNVLWISLEDASPRFGCYGDVLARTPNIDRLTAQGCLFPNAFAVAGVCAPSRSAVITGMYPTSVGTMHMRTLHENAHTPDLPTPYSVVLPHYVKPFTEYLRAEGYYCSNNWKTDYQFESPVTAWDDCSRTAHWRNREPNQPFFAVFNPTFTHESEMWKHPDRPLVTDPDQIELPPYLPDTRISREALACQYDNIALADEYVGRILQELEDDGLTDRTIVMLWSDHGEGLPRAKRWPYDAGIRVPLIVRWPGTIRPGSVNGDLVSLVDLGPTVLSLTETAIPYHMQGRPFVGRAAQTRSYVYATRDRYDSAYDMMRAVRDKRFKYIRNYRPDNPYMQWIPYSHQHPIWSEIWRRHAEGKLEGPQQLMMQRQRPVEELYDCANDPHEIRNLAQNPDCLPELERLRKALDDWRREAGDMGELAESEMVNRMWPGGEQPVTSAPLVIPIHAPNNGRTPLNAGESTLESPVELMLHCSTQGASIAYSTEEGDNPHWKLYTGPLRMAAGRSILRTKAVRIGYAESREMTVRLTIT